MKHNKKGQAALEFLSTYGFAFLIILVMIGALAYFGVLNPQNFLPDRCTSAPEIGCDEYRVIDSSGTPELNAFFINQVGSSITPHDFVVTSPSGVLCPSPFVGSPATVAAGNEIEVECTLDGQQFAPGQRIRVDYDLVYQQVGNRFNSTVSGQIYARMG